MSWEHVCVFMSIHLYVTKDLFEIVMMSTVTLGAETWTRMCRRKKKLEFVENKWSMSMCGVTDTSGLGSKR